MRATLGLVVVGFLAAACSSMSFVDTNPSPRPLTPRTASTVEVYTTDEPSDAYTEIGIMEAGEGMFDDMESMIDSMREEAGAHGCDGIILTERSEEISTSSDSDTNSRTIYSATCFVYDNADSPNDAVQSQAFWHIRLAAGN